MTRRRLFWLAGGAALTARPPEQAQGAGVTLLTAPLEVGGDWNGSSPRDALAVIARARAACLRDVRLLSDRQPARLRVDDRRDGPPSVWLHTGQPETAWVVVDIGARDWSKLAYQFGHELGHVLSNSWRWGDNPKPPSQWIEESVVEAFSIRGLALLADSWEHDPPFPNDAAFAGVIRQYRARLLDGYRKAAKTVDLAAWFQADRPALPAGIKAAEGPAVAPVLDQLEHDAACIADMGALNRWPERTAVPAESYLKAWRASCLELQAPGRLPVFIEHLLGLG